MKQRVGIARALATEPRVLLLDEPFGALDALTRASLQDELVRIVEGLRSTVVMVTHDIDEAILLSDRVVMMTNGPAAKIGDAVEIALTRPRDRIELAGRADYALLSAAAARVSLSKATRGHRCGVVMRGRCPSYGAARPRGARNAQNIAIASTAAALISARCSGVASLSSSSRLMIEPASSSTAGI